MRKCKNYVTGVVLGIVVTMLVDTHCFPIQQMTPQRVQVKLNDTASISCSTSKSIDIQWHHRHPFSESSSPVYARGNFFSPYKDRFRLENPKNGLYILVIPDAVANDAGLYECKERQAANTFAVAQLTVFESNPVCVTDMNPDGFVGPNTCNIQQENMTFSCAVSFIGQPPHLVWRSTINHQSLTTPICIVQSNRIECILILESDPSYDGSIFICKTADSSDRQYMCSTDIIKIQYLSVVQDTADKNVHDNASCKVKSNLDIRYNWTLEEDDQNVFLSQNQTIFLQRQGTHKCEVEYSLRNTACVALVSAVNVTISTEDHWDSNKKRSDELTPFQIGLFVVQIMGMILNICYGIQCYHQRQAYKHIPSEVELDPVKIWRTEILRACRSLPKHGLPGRIIVYGNSAEPILTSFGEVGNLNNCIAAAEYGKGRIICASHDSFGKHFGKNENELEKFHENVKLWLTRGTFSMNDEIINASDKTDRPTLESSKIILYNGGSAEISPEQMEDFVRKGGGLFHAFTPLEWQQLNEGRPLSDAQYYNLLQESGICYTEDTVRTTGDVFSIDSNSNGGAHLLRVLRHVRNHPEKIKEQYYKLQSLKRLPKIALDKLRVTHGAVSILWQSEILRDVRYLSLIQKSGRISVFGENAEPIFTGSDKNDVLVAAAEYGDGRIICVSHSAYCDGFPEGDTMLEKFHNSVKKWLTRGKICHNTSIINAADKCDQQALRSAMIIYWNGRAAQISENDMTEFVRKGGGLFYCMSGLELRPKTESLSMLPYSSLLKDAGISLTRDRIRRNTGVVFVRHNKASLIYDKLSCSSLTCNLEKMKQRQAYIEQGRLPMHPTYR